MVGLAAVLVALGLMEMSRVLVQARTGTKVVRWDPLAQPPPPDDDDLTFIAFFTDELSIVMDLSGNMIGEGTHGGEIRCNSSHCSQKTQLDFSSGPYVTRTYEYKFTTRQALDREAERAVVGGKGTISGGRQKERFSFTATFQNNQDGTVSIRYEASRPDASFVIPRAPGRLLFLVRSRKTVQGVVYR
jgi:hypothetical protein